MHEILTQVGPAGTILDLGCGAGSFPSTQATIIRMDREAHRDVGDLFVIADATSLPLPDNRLQAVICNHSLEHIVDFERALEEIGRTLQPNGALFVSVPDASTFTDHLYRWLASGGGHVNSFRHASTVAHQIESLTGLRHVGTRNLFSSLSFLHPDNRPSKPPFKLRLLGGGRAWSLRLYTLFSRWSDRFLGSRLSLYGWAMYFGEGMESIQTRGWPSVCIRCGAGIPSDQLLTQARVYRRWGLLRCYDCPNCTTWNFFFPDSHFGSAD